MKTFFSRLTRFRKWLPEVAIFAVLFGGIHFYNTRDMLNADYEPAPPLVLDILDGGVGGLIEGSDRPALVYFFAPWCQVCAASAHNIRNLRRAVDEEDLSVFMVALSWDTVAEVQDYAARHELDVPVLLGTRETSRDWGISVFPTYYIVDSQQRVAHRDYGYSTLAGLWLRTAWVQ